MSMGRSSSGRVVEMLVFGGKVLVYWCVFLGLLEVVDWVATNQGATRALDGIAMMTTAVLFGLSTLGVRLAIGRITRTVKKEE